MKKVLAVFLAVVLLVCACSFSAYSAILDDSYKAAGFVEEDKEPTTSCDDPHDYDPVVCVTNTMNWDKVYLYIWGKDGRELTGKAPGVELPKVQQDNFGRDVYEIKIPQIAEGFCFYNGSGDRTQDIMDFWNCRSYWISNEKDNDGCYQVSMGYIYPSEPTEPVTHITYNENDEFDTYIYFTDRGVFDGEVYLYSWNEDGDLLSGEWPGTKLTSVYSNNNGWEIFRIGIPEDCQGIVLSNGGNLYTEDITDFNLNSECWLTGNKDEWNRYRVYNKYNNDNNIPIPTEDNDPNRKETLLIADTLNWGTGYLFAWDSNGNSLCGEWPGTMITETRVNEFGETEFVCNISRTAVGIVVNNGNGAQSTDITDFSTYDGYWFDGTTQESGFYNAKGFVVEIPATDATVEPTEMTLGDINGDGIITVADATMIQEYAAELRDFDPTELCAADTNHDGIVSVSDATLIQQYAAEMIDAF